jgi:hypothetical protein
MQGRISPALFRHGCLSISVDAVQDIGAEILRIKMNCLWGNVRSSTIAMALENGDHSFQAVLSFRWIQVGS